MSKASRERRKAARAAVLGPAVRVDASQRTDEIRREQLREDPVVQSLVAEALKNYAQRVSQHLHERDALARSLAVLLARMPGGRVVIKPEEVLTAKGWSIQTLIDRGTLVHYVLRDEMDKAAAAQRERAAVSGLVLP